MSEFKGFKKSDGTLIPCRDDSKQATLTTQQLAAVNSGITSEKVAKIATIDERTANVSQLARDVEQISEEMVTVDTIREEMAALPDGSAVSAQVALNTADIKNILIEETVGKNMFNMNSSENEAGKVMSSTIQTSSSYTLSHPIAVKPNTTYYISNTISSSLNARYVAELSAADATSSLRYSQNVSLLTTGANTNFVRLSLYNGKLGGYQMELGDTKTSYEAYSCKRETKVYDKTISEDKLDDALKNKIGIKKDGYLRETGDLADGEELTLAANCVKSYKEIVFFANITTFNKITIGHGRLGGYSSTWIEIDNTNIYTHMNSNTAADTIAHGLTIGTDIIVRVKKDFHVNWGTIEVISNGVSKKVETHWTGDCGEIYAKSTGSTLTDCALSWTSKTLDSPIWIFGGSYLSITSDRWTYYLKNYHDNVLIDGVSGSKSEYMYNDLLRLLNIATPKKIVWMLGMNDPDTSTAVNTSWNTYYGNVKALCEEKGIELILTTIPTARGGVVDDSDVPANLRINKYKNAIVRASGLRYVDFDKAVGANETTGEWFAGMLSSDGVHPTTAGAITLFNRVLADVPEILKC